MAVSVKRADEERGHPTYQTTLKMVKLTDHKYSPDDTEKVNYKLILPVNA